MKSSRVFETLPIRILPILAILILGFCTSSPAFAEQSSISNDKPDIVIDDSMDSSPIGEDPDELSTPETVDSARVRTIAIIEVAEGHTVEFVSLLDAEGSSLVGVFEDVSPGEQVVTRHPELDGATPLQIFHALTTDDVEVPQALLDAELLLEPQTPIATDAMSAFEAVDTADPLDRGWALSELLSDAGLDGVAGVNASYACNNNSIVNLVSGLTYPSRFFLFNTHPSSASSYWTNYCEIAGNGWCASGGSRYKFLHTRYNNRRYTGRVCGEPTGSHNWYYNGSTYQKLPYVTFQYRDQNNNGWYTALNREFPLNTVKHFYWAFYQTTPQTRLFDWRTSVRAAKTADVFDIGIGWEQ